MRTSDSLVNIIETLMHNQLQLEQEIEQLRKELGLLQNDVRVLVDERGQAKNNRTEK